MTNKTVPDFDQLANLMIGEGAVTFSPSELHGLMVGNLVAGRRLSATELEQFCAQQLDIDAGLQPASTAGFGALYAAALEQLSAGEFELRLLLPDDDQSLPQRAEQLGHWVSGFLVGFGLGVGDNAAQLSAEAQESLKDLVQIGQIEADAEGEEEEALLMEVEEYVRMAAMLLFAECSPQNSGASQPTSQLH